MEVVLELGEGKSIRFPKEGGVTSVGLKEGCPECGQPDCYEHYNYKTSPSGPCEDVQEMIQRKVVNTAIDAVESLLLSLIKAGMLNVFINSDKIADAVQTTLDAIVNNVGD
jgi:hypothetical protein